MSTAMSGVGSIVPEVVSGKRMPHVAIIMDGNGRWARSQGFPRSAGHRTGAVVAREIVEASADLDIGTLTLFALSSENFARPPMEVARIMCLLRRYAREFGEHSRRHEVRLEFIGQRQRLPAIVRREMRRAELGSAQQAERCVRIAVDYSAAASLAAAGDCGGDVAELQRRVNRAVHSRDCTPPVDLLIRTGGEQRLSDFMLLESAWAELWFSDVLWPDFTVADLIHALNRFDNRERRFGRVLAPRSLPSVLTA